jgi:biopolymer transport protein TolR
MSLWTRALHRSDAELNLIPLIDVMSVMVAFLLIYSADVEVVQNSKGVEIPQSSAEAKAQQSVVVMITKDQLFVQGELVASIAEIGGTSTPLIEPLQQVLGRPLLAQGHGSEDASREITVVADKSLPFDVVRRVMATCTASGYGKVLLAVLEKERSVTAGS